MALASPLMCQCHRRENSSCELKNSLWRLPLLINVEIPATIPTALVAVRSEFTTSNKYSCNLGRSVWFIQCSQAGYCSASVRMQDIPPFGQTERLIFLNGEAFKNSSHNLDDENNSPHSFSACTITIRKKCELSFFVLGFGRNATRIRR